MTPRRIETASDLEAVISEQDQGILGLGNLVRSMDTQIKAQDAQIKLLTALLDAHHEIFIAHGWAKPRPAEETPLVH